MWSNKNQREERQTDTDASLEPMLRERLQRRATPEGLQERIVARAMAERTAEISRQGTLPNARRGAMRSGNRSRLLRLPQEGRQWAVQRVAASVVLGLMVAGMAAYYQAEQRRTERKAEQARAQVMEALRITSRTLDKVQSQLNDGQ